MNVFELRDRLVADYATYTRSFIKIADARVREKVDSELAGGLLWPEPLLQLNPTFLRGGKVDDLVSEGVLHSECKRIFRVNKTDQDHFGNDLQLHKHQAEAINKAKAGKSYVLTSGTGSGKSLTYIIPIVDHVLRHGSGQGIQAIVVYPMNALANSQDEELKKFLVKGYQEGNSPVRFARYTGQVKGDLREAIRNNPPDILLTNYEMLELLLTRREDRALVRAAQGLKYLVFDELHTYRGRQGADIALLIRRCRLAFGSREMICVGTSATMASEGNSLDQKREVAKVAETLFGTAFDESQVVGEYLERSTPEIELNDPSIIQALRTTIESKEIPDLPYDEFRQHPLSSWIESTFGVRTELSTGRLIRQSPRRLKGHNGAAEELAKLIGVASTDLCAEILKGFLLRGSTLYPSESSRFPIFAFRLHQFLTRGDTVWSTLESEDVRYLELTKVVAKPGELDKPLYPLVFCRQCGTAYYRVKVQNYEGRQSLLPREDRKEIGEDGGGEAYLYLSSSNPWPTHDSDAILERVPAFMKETMPIGGERLKSEYRKDLPIPIFVNPQGQIVSEGSGERAALIQNNFFFCLEPSCGVAYNKLQRSERMKLATLGVDSRSTATTILAVRSLIELQIDHSLKSEARKLLSFTDNRQDASLQAGHFNDFAQVALLRSALHKAMSLKGNVGLSHGELSRSVFDALSLNFEEYAADPEVRGPARTATQDAFRQVIDYHLYRDLLSGWRVTAPNLEDCGLLRFDYDGLHGEEGLLADSQLWQDGFDVKIDRLRTEKIRIPNELRSLSENDREEVIRTLLDLLRRSLVVKVDVLDSQRQLDLIERTKPRLLEGTVWYLESTQDLVKSQIAYPRPRQGNDRNGLFVSAYGSFGRYLKRKLASNLPLGYALNRNIVDESISFLFQALKLYGIIEQVRSDNVPGYQINHAALRWISDTGEIRQVDRTRLLQAGEIPPEVNRYFVECYRGFVDLKCRLEAREHTAQVASEDREIREERFRDADLPLLFCSPTMELGVDIAQLNVVNLRNVPPTPANYAQRSGRAGRGGQPALVYTYCAGRSPHDQYYFNKPHDMVAGTVAPPRIDLRNQDLIKSHIHSIWMEVTKPDLGKTLMSVLDIVREQDKIHIPVKPIILNELTDPRHKADALRKSNELVGSISAYLNTATWFHENWTKEVLDKMASSFDKACDRWRELYRAALRQRELHHKILGDHSRPEAERKHSMRLRGQAEAQMKLLTEAEGVFEGDFYSYRYFAAEGFLPGYNFPRLPISAYVPARRDRKGRDEFLSRPRFLAVSEFGPRALIYHEGARYRVYKVNLDFGSDDIETTHNLVTSTIKRCPSCGYGHLESGQNLTEVCDRCGTALDGPATIENLVQLQNVSLKMAQRITCDEEERQRYGYKLATSYRFSSSGGGLDRKDAEVVLNGVTVLKMSYGDSTELYRINLGWGNQRDEEPKGFMLDLERGYWEKNQNDADDREDASAGRKQRVVPFVRDTKNALVMRFEPVRDDRQMASLQSAFKVAIQKYFQLEPRELTCEAMPERLDRKEILYYEASEGGAGVLRQIVEEPRILPALARKALELCHFDPDTLTDLKSDSCGKACYECLLDYFNQPDHQILDRYAIRDILAELARAECKPSGGVGSRAERLINLRRNCDSTLEKRWLELVDSQMLNLPSHSQFLLETHYTRPDFYYHEHNAAIYVDGPVHDEPDQMRKDQEIDERLLMASFVVIRFHHKADWSAIFRRHPDIFGTPR